MTNKIFKNQPSVANKINGGNNDMTEKSREKNSHENKRQSQMRKPITSASFLLALLVVVTATEAVQASATPDANENILIEVTKAHYEKFKSETLK
jgi:hypothetical protein